MPLIETKGAASAQGFGEFARSAAPSYIEDVFSTYLYPGTGSTHTITNGIDLAGKGGLVWIKGRSGVFTVTSHRLFDTARGIWKSLQANATDSQLTLTNTLTAFNTNGFTLGTDGGIAEVNWNGMNYASWTFRKQEKFFDVVTYTGDGTSSRSISHSLGSAPGFIITKRTDSASNWRCYHVSLGINQTILLDSTNAVNSDGTFPAAPTSSTFTVGTFANQSGGTYVAYLFAHNAGGFGLSGSDNVISCGSYTGNGSATGPTITLGYEPQFVMVKASSTTGNWVIEDTMRGMSQTASNELFPNLTNAETALNPGIIPNATGFSLGTTNADMNSNGVTYIYIAIRRGPMKVPTSGTSVFFPTTTSAIGSSDWSTAPLSEKSVDCLIGNTRTSSPNSGFIFTDRLRGLNGSYSTSTSVNLNSTSTAAETTATYPLQLGDSGGSIDTNRSYPNSITYLLKRAPGFFDVVCYTGNGSGTNTVNHNLQAAPELTIVKSRSTSGAGYGWGVRYLSSTITVFNGWTAGLNLTAQATATGVSNDASWAINSSSFNAYGGGYGYPNDSSKTYIAYLFATCLGVSKVGSYTGSGTTKQIDCGFTGGARFVLIKRTDSTGDWYVYDSARGIVAGNDPYLFLNSTAAEVTSTDYIDTYSAGFELSSTAPAGLNANGGTYIFLAIA